MVAERGQLLLIAGILVATTIVGSVVLLNAIHADADVLATQETQSLSEAERTADDVQSDVEELLLQTTSVAQTGERLPYANVTDFENESTEYAEQYRNLTASSKAALVDISFTGGETGAAVRQTEELALEGDVVEGATSLPRLSMNVTEFEFPGQAQAQNLTIELGDDTVELTVSNETVAFDGPTHDWTCDIEAQGDTDSSWVTIENWNGAVEVRDHAGNACDRQLELPDDEFNVTFDGAPPGEPIHTNGTVLLTAAGADPAGDFGENDPGEGERWGVDDVVVNPVFELRYDDASVGYASEITVYEERYHE